MNYPNGKKKISLQHKGDSPKHSDFSNRGMSLEKDINVTNQYYLNIDRAVIHKKPTPVQVVNVHYPKRSAAVITEGYYKQASTTDYNGIYRNKYIDFEAKETRNKTRFPLKNIHEHQIMHMKAVKQHGGISFLIIRFSVYNEAYLMPVESFLPFWNNQLHSGKKSIPYDIIQKEGYLIPFHFQARIDYLTVIDKLYF